MYCFCKHYVLSGFQGHEYTKNCYIATQGPLQNTIYDFWMMVYQNNTGHWLPQASDPSPRTSGVQKIVMLTNFIENNRQKCEKYFPSELHEEVQINCPDDEDKWFVLKNSGMIRKAGYTIRKLDVRYFTRVIAKSGQQGVMDMDDQNIIPDASGQIAADSESSDRNACDSEKEQTHQSDSEIKLDSAHSVRDIDTSNGSAVPESVTVYHYWFHNWADHKCPKDVNALLNLSLDVLKDSLYDFNLSIDENEDICKCNDSPKSESKFLFPPLETPVPCEAKVSVSTPLDLSVESVLPPTIVHCSAGIGRTGCLIAILNGIKQLFNEQKVDVLGIVCNMRLNRGGMVQNSEQYELIHKVLCLYEQACLPKL